MEKRFLRICIHINTNHKSHYDLKKELAARNLQGMIQDVPWCCNINTVLNGRNLCTVSVAGKEIV